MDGRAKTLGVCTAAFVLIIVGATLFQSYLQELVYQDSSTHLLSTYQQVGRTFSLFSQRNWNWLDDCDAHIATFSDAEDIKEQFATYAERKESWNYSDLYLFNEENRYVTASGRAGTAASIAGVFDQMYREDSSIVSSYVASNGVRKVVFARPLSHEVALDGVTYTGIALSYEDETVQGITSENVYDGESDCYVVSSSGKIMLALAKESEVPKRTRNLYHFLNAHASFSLGSLNEIKRGTKADTSGCAVFSYKGIEYYLTWQHSGIDGCACVGIVRRSAVDDSLVRIQRTTIAVLLLLASVASGLLIYLVSRHERGKVQQKENERLELEHQKVLADQLFQGMGQIVERFAVVDLVNDSYEYREHALDQGIYPEVGTYGDLLKAVSRRYVALATSEDAKMGHLLAPERLRSELITSRDILKFEYRERSEKVYMAMSVVGLDWSDEGVLTRAMLIVQDIGQKIELRDIANTDELTGLFNKRFFNQVLAARSARQEPFAVFYIDLDLFKPVNDTYGHPMGDKMLKEVAMRLLECVRSDDFAFRTGGDEFVLLVSSAMSEVLCWQVTERVRKTIEREFVIDGHELHVGVSCGWAIYPAEGDVEEVCALADKRMYANKERHHAER